MNFGETLAYWYLRFNGFFPLVNFVLHRDVPGIRSFADCDILAIRHPHTFEQIGGQEQDWDNARFANWGLDLQHSTIGLIVEVKTGKNTQRSRENIRLSFGVPRLIYSIHRLGFWDEDEAPPIAELLHTRSTYYDGNRNLMVGKLLISTNPPRLESIPPCLMVGMREIQDFILGRIESYSQAKEEARLRFPSDLMQYIIWSSGIRPPYI